MAKNSMTKRLIGTLIAIIIAFSFLGCQSLQAYKENAKIKLDNYIYQLPEAISLSTSPEVRNHINGLIVDKIVSDGKNSIDNARNKKDVDKALDAAKREFDTIPIVFPMSGSSFAAEVETMGQQFLFYLKIFDENISYECTAGVGAIYSFPRPDEPLSPIYDGYFGRHPQIIRWYVGRTELEDGTFEVLHEQDFIDFIIKIDDAIIGYIVVGMSFDKTQYLPKLLASVVNPKANGKYQTMDEDQVQIDIASIKEKNV